MGPHLHGLFLARPPVEAVRSSYKGKDSMKVFGFLDPLFRVLSDGKIIRLTFAWVLRALAILLALLGLLWFVAMLALGFKFSNGAVLGNSVGFLIGCIVLAIFGLAWGALTSGFFVFRARSIAELGESHFPVLSIWSILLRLLGEFAFITYALLGAGGCLFVWFADIPFSALGELGDAAGLASRLPFASNAGSGFLGGIELLILFLILAFIGIVICYAAAELTIVLVEIAANTLKTVQNTRYLQPAFAAIPDVPAPPREAPEPEPAGLRQTMEQAQPQPAAEPSCQSCGMILDPGSAFCGTCGAKAG
jgi:hypothetical protein